jgi:O-antigen biosynthesis protein
LNGVSLSIPKIAKQLGKVSSFSTHDFYTICPTTHLLDETGKFCGGTCTANSNKDCSSTRTDLFGFPVLKNRFVNTWQARMGQTLENFTFLIAPSESAKRRIVKIFPSVASRIAIVPHERSDIDYRSPMAPVESGPPFRVLALGAIGVHKGSTLFAALIPELARMGITIDFYGEVDHNLLSAVRKVRPYERANLSALVPNGVYSAALFLSVWDETFAHTLTEAWSLGIPAIGLDFGAIGERIKKTGNGLVLPNSLLNDPSSLAKLISETLSDRDWRNLCEKRLTDWQRNQETSSIFHMARSYESLWLDSRDG